jgi:hypothetical protein
VAVSTGELSTVPIQFTMDGDFVEVLSWFCDFFRGPYWLYSLAKKFASGIVYERN